MTARTTAAPPREGTKIPSAKTRVERAHAAVGAGAELSGLCEKFVRTCFGFAARYPSARQAWEATTRRRGGEAPAGVPVFWDITTGARKDFDHVAISVGGGLCVSTSVGDDHTVAAVGIDELTRRWGMLYRGWSGDYHGVVVHDEEVTTLTGAPWPSRDLPGTSAHTAGSLSAWRRLMASIGLTEVSLELSMQRWLRRLGHYGESWLLDGQFGVESTSALQRFLATKGLYPYEMDGWRGPLTVQAELRYLNAQRRCL